MIQPRYSNERGRTKLDWLDSRHTFSFDQYYDPQHMQFRSLRVINEDVVAPAGGFGTHPHRDMEIITYVLEGALQHRDSTGTTSVIRPGEVQKMSAGTGILHSEYNPSETDPVHLLQIWILPGQRGLKPSYEQKAFNLDAGLVAVAGSPPGEEPDGSNISIQQDAALYAGKLAAGSESEHRFSADRHGWLQVARGAVTANGIELKAGDGAAISGEPAIRIRADQDSEVLLFDLA